MPKRKKPGSEQSPKKQKLDVSADSHENVANITSKKGAGGKENLPWPLSDIQELLHRIEEHIPKDDTVSYSCRLEKLDWGKIAFKKRSVKECKEVWAVLYKQVRKFRFLSEIVADVKEWLKTPKVTHPMSSLRHPDKPKQAKNAYMLFLEENRPKVASANPHFSHIEVIRKVGELYKDLSVKEREKYEQRAKVLKKEYLEKLQLFYESHPELVPIKTKTGKKFEFEEGRGPPTKPKTPFELFMKVESEKEELDASKYVVTLKCRERWNELSDKEKYFWINWAEEQYAVYLEEMKEYLKEHPHYEPGNVKSILTIKEKEIKKRCSGKPEKPPLTAYLLFSKMVSTSEEAQQLSRKEVMYFMSEKWKVCSEEDKKQYEIRVEQMWEEYEIKFEQYIETVPPQDRDRVREEEGLKRRKRKKKESQTPPKPKVKLPKPQKPPSSGFKYFKLNFKEEGDPRAVWKAMSVAERKKIYADLAEAKKKYLVDYEQHLKSLTREELEKLGERIAMGFDSGNESSSSSSEEEEENEEDED